MFDYIKGILTNKSENVKGAYLTVEANGIGYLAEVAASDLCKVKAGEEIKLYTVLIHREDTMFLCGFVQHEARDIFKILTSVSGVGVKMAFALLNDFGACDIISLVVGGNYKALTKAKGVGDKLAQKIILELKDKLMNFQTETPVTLDGIDADEGALSDAQNVLLSLGYQIDEIKTALKTSLPQVKDKCDAQEILKETLLKLSI